MTKTKRAALLLAPVVTPSLVVAHGKWLGWLIGMEPNKTALWLAASIIGGVAVVVATVVWAESNP